jgi:hypothetical protein
MRQSSKLKGGKNSSGMRYPDSSQANYKDYDSFNSKVAPFSHLKTSESGRKGTQYEAAL